MSPRYITHCNTGHKQSQVGQYAGPIPGTQSSHGHPGATRLCSAHLLGMKVSPTSSSCFHFLPYSNWRLHLSILLSSQVPIWNRQFLLASVITVLPCSSLLLFLTWALPKTSPCLQVATQHRRCSQLSLRLCVLTLWNKVRQSLPGWLSLVSDTAPAGSWDCSPPAQHMGCSSGPCGCHCCSQSTPLTCHCHCPARVLVRRTSEKHKATEPHADLEVSEKTQLTCLLLYLSHQQGHSAPVAVPHPDRAGWESHTGLPASPELLS